MKFILRQQHRGQLIVEVLDVHRDQHEIIHLTL